MGQTNRNDLIIKCHNCGTKNRIPRNRIKDRPICGRCKSPLRIQTYQDRPLDISDANFDSDVLGSSLPVLVDCWAPWCGPCRLVGPVLEELASEYAGRVKIRKLNVDENPNTASRYGIRSIPTMLFFKDGKKVNSLVGALPKEQIERHLKSIM